jgi:hypothetical protein
MLSNKSIILLTLLILASALSAWSITDSYFGNRFGSMDARILAMGGAGLYNEYRPFGFTDNPANLTLLNKNIGLAVNTYMDRNEDDRAIPLYNSFDNYIDDSVYSSNINFYNNFAAAAMGAYRYNQFKLGAGVFHKPYTSFDNDYVEEIRNNRNTDNDGYPEKIAQNTIEGRGSLTQTGAALAFAFEPNEILSANLGASFAMLSGNITNEKSILWTQWAVDQVGSTRNLPNLVETTDYDLSGMQMKIGGAVRLSNRLGFAATYTPKATLDKEGSYYYKRDAYYQTAVDSLNTIINEDYILPTELRIGISYMPRNVMRTVFNLDLEYVMQSDISELYNDVVNLYAGVEHHVTNRIPFRLGFSAVNSYFFTTEDAMDADNNPITVYYVKKILTPSITAGSSVQLTKNLSCDLGFGYSWREFEAVDLFGDAYYDDREYTGSTTYVLWPNSHLSLQNRGWENPDKVRENNISLNAGLSFTW